MQFSLKLVLLAVALQQTFAKIVPKQKTAQKNQIVAEPTNDLDTAAASKTTQYEQYDPSNNYLDINPNHVTNYDAPETQPNFAQRPEFNSNYYQNLRFAPSPDSFIIQNGFEGYLTPHVPSNTKEVSTQTSLTETLVNTFSGYMPALKSIGNVVQQIFGVIAALTGITAIGGGLTAAICYFTPLCSISLFPSLPFKAAMPQKRSIEGNAKPTEKELEDSVTNLIKSIDKYESAAQASVKGVDGKKEEM